MHSRQRVKKYDDLIIFFFHTLLSFSLFDKVFGTEWYYINLISFFVVSVIFMSTMDDVEIVLSRVAISL